MLMHSTPVASNCSRQQVNAVYWFFIEGTYMNLQDNKQDQNQNLNFNRNAQNSTGSNSWVSVS